MSKIRRYISSCMFVVSRSKLIFIQNAPFLWSCLLSLLAVYESNFKTANGGNRSSFYTHFLWFQNTQNLPTYVNRMVEKSPRNCVCFRIYHAKYFKLLKRQYYIIYRSVRNITINNRIQKMLKKFMQHSFKLFWNHRKIKYMLFYYPIFSLS